MSEETKRGRGRPKTKGKGFDSVSTIRFNPDEINMLSELSRETDATKSEIVRNAVRTYYYMKKNPEFFRST